MKVNRGNTQMREENDYNDDDDDDDDNIQTSSDLFCFRCFLLT